MEETDQGPTTPNEVREDAGLSQQEPTQDSGLQTPQPDQPHPPVEDDPQKDESAAQPVEQGVPQETSNNDTPDED